MSIKNLCVYSNIQEETIMYVDRETFLVFYSCNTLVKPLNVNERFSSFKNLCHLDLILKEVLK